MSTSKRFQVALLIDDDFIQKWAARAVNHMVRTTEAELSVIVINEGEPNKDQPPWKLLSEAIDTGLWSLVVACRKLLWALGYPPKYIRRHKEKVPVHTLNGIEKAKIIKCRPIQTEGFGNELPHDIVNVIADNSDVAVRFGFGILTGSVLEAPKHGVVSFHGGDLTKYRGKPPGFWEFLADEDSGAFVLQQLTENLDAGRIVAFERVSFDNDATLQDMKLSLYNTSEEMLAQGIHHLQDPDFEPREPNELGDMYSTPTGVAVIRYLLKNNYRRLCG